MSIVKRWDPGLFPGLEGETHHVGEEIPRLLKSAFGLAWEGGFPAPIPPNPAETVPRLHPVELHHTHAHTTRELRLLTSSSYERCRRRRCLRPHPPAPPPPVHTSRIHQRYLPSSTITTPSPHGKIRRRCRLLPALRAVHGVDAASCKLRSAASGIPLHQGPRGQRHLLPRPDKKLEKGEAKRTRRTTG